MINIFLIDKHPVIRQGLKSILEKAGFQVSGAAGNVKEALPQIDELKPDIVILDDFRDEGDNIDDITILQRKKIKIFVLTDSEREHDFLKAIKGGVRGYLLKASEVSHLIDAIRLVAADGTVVYSSKAASLFDSTLQETTRTDRLSQREKEMLNLVARGYSNKEIASRCFVSEATVKAHLRKITGKLNVKNRAEAAATAIDKGLIEIHPHSLNK